MSKFLKLFNTQAELQAWLATYTGTDVIAAYARYDNSQGEKEYELSLTASMSQTTFDYEAGSANIGIDANCSWTIVVSGDWITVSKLEGAGPDNILVSIPQNDGDEDRQGSIGIFVDGVDKVKFDIYQSYHSQPNNEIWYSSTDGNIVTPTGQFGNANILSNTYENGMGIITFDIDVVRTDQSFAGCTTLATLMLPNSVRELRTSLCQGCTSLTYVKLPSAMTYVGDYSFNGCSSLISVEIPYGPTFIYDSAFRNCSSLVSVTIPDSVTSIDSAAFINCSALVSVNIPNSVTNIGANAFSSCYALASVNIPNGVTNIPIGAFQSCYALASLIIPSGVTNIGINAFSFCGFTGVTCLPTVPPTLGSDAFFSYNDWPIYVPAASVDAYKAAWSAYASRIQAIPEPTQPDNEIWYHTTDGQPITLYSSAYIYDENEIGAKGVNISNTYENGKGIITFAEGQGFGDSITGMSNTFRTCTNLLDVSLPPAMREIKANCFTGCTALTAITFNEGLTGITSTYNFAKVPCDLVMPASVTNYHSSTFQSFAGTSITFPNPVPPEVTWMSGKFPTTCHIYVPASSIDAYRAAWPEQIDQIFPIYE